jgi:hypothetical protein
MSLLTPISSFSRWSERPKQSAVGEHVGEHPLEPCVRANNAASTCGEPALRARRRHRKSVQAGRLAPHINAPDGGVLCRPDRPRTGANFESGRERPHRDCSVKARLSVEWGRSRPDASQIVPHDVGPTRARIVPHSSAPVADSVARFYQPRTLSIAAEGGPAAWH